MHDVVIFNVEHPEGRYYLESNDTCVLLGSVCTHRYISCLFHTLHTMSHMSKTRCTAHGI